MGATFMSNNQDMRVATTSSVGLKSTRTESARRMEEIERDRVRAGMNKT
jgi:hypothetical protein